MRYGGGQRVDPELEAGSGDRVLPEPVLGRDLGLGPLVVVAERQEPVVRFVVVREDEPALAAGQRLRAVERERPGHPEGADLLAAVRRTVGVGTVFQQQKVVRLGDGPDGDHRGRPAPQVGDHDSAGAWSDRVLDRGGVEVAVRSGLDQDRHRPQMEQRRGCGVEGPGGDDHLVPGLDRGGVVGSVQGRGAGAEGDRVPNAEVVLEGVLQVGDDARTAGDGDGRA